VKSGGMGNGENIMGGPKKPCNTEKEGISNRGTRKEGGSKEEVCMCKKKKQMKSPVDSSWGLGECEGVKGKKKCNACASD